jgi:formylglycine-generating enzyme required for sulfatase activity
MAGVAGNVWEWTSSLWGSEWRKPEFGYPYNPRDGREDQQASKAMARAVRGGPFNLDRLDARCACRDGVYPYARDPCCGFRVVVFPLSPSSAI